MMDHHNPDTLIEWRSRTLTGVDPPELFLASTCDTLVVPSHRHVRMAFNNHSIGDSL